MTIHIQETWTKSRLAAEKNIEDNNKNGNPLHKVRVKRLDLVAWEKQQKEHIRAEDIRLEEAIQVEGTAGEQQMHVDRLQAYFSRK